MTEDEAKLKWCPYQGIGVKADSSAGERARCIGSECMAWRTSFTTESVGGTIKRTYEDGHGFCGLAGKP